MRPSRIALLRGMLVCAGLSLVAIQALAGSPSLALVPMPQEIRVRAGRAVLGPEWTISSTDPKEDEPAMRLLAAEAADCLGWAWRVVSASPPSRTIELRTMAASGNSAPLFSEQGYRLTISSSRVVIEGVTPRGRFYGVQTLRQLLRMHPHGAIPCLRIVDFPALAWRGVSDDISRGQTSTVEDFKAIIRQLAYYKINLYQVYIEDMFLFEGSATTGRSRGALTSRDLAQLVEEGRRNHVVVSPIFESLAHQERLLSLKDHERFGARDVQAEATPTGLWETLLSLARRVSAKLVISSSADIAKPVAFSASDPHTLDFVLSLVDEIAAVTRGPFFHIGGDEWQLPAASSSSNAPTGDDAIRSYGRYLGRVADHLRARFGCRAMVYGDVLLEHPEAAADLPRNCIVIDWHYDPDDSFPSLRQIKAQGFRDVMVSPALWTWRTFYPNYARGFRNVAKAAQAAKREHVMGCITATWGDGGAENLRENNWTGYAFAAAASWEVDTPAADPFLRRFVVAHYGVDSPELVRAERLLGWQEFDAMGWGGRLYYRPLLVRPQPLRVVGRMSVLSADMSSVEQALDAGEERARFNRDHLAAVRHCARRFGYVAERELFLDETGRTLVSRNAAQLPPAERERIVREIDRLESTANALQTEYKRLWLRHNRPEGLSENLDRMAKQGAMLQRLRELTRRGLLKVDQSYSDRQALGAPR